MEVLARHLFLQLLDALGFVLRQNLTHHATFGDSHLRFKGMDFVGDVRGADFPAHVHPIVLPVPKPE